MKKFLKITGLYLLFGVLINLFLSVFGLFTGMTDSGLVTASEYAVFSTLIFSVCWLAFCISIIVSDMAYFPLPMGKISVALITILFTVLCLRIVFEKSK